MTERTRLEGTAPTRIDLQGAVGATRIEQLPSGSAPVSGSLPLELAKAFDVRRAFDAAGSEADLFLVERRSDGRQCVLKLYRRGLHPKIEVLEKLQGCDRRFVVETIGSGESEGFWYEVLEYGAAGTLRDLMGNAPIPEETLRVILKKLNEAISYVHSIGIVHRDLKPENVLVRSRSPLDLVLSDFGISSLSSATHHFTTRSRTIKYGAPESAIGVVGPASDFWSLGLIILEALTGRHPFDALSDIAIAWQLTTANVDTSGIANARWRLLCRGLLTRDPQKRWTAEAISTWLSGGAPPVVDDVPIRPAQKPYKFSKVDCFSTAELALELGRHWELGERHLARGLILPWLREELRDQDAANLHIDLTETRSLTNADRLLRLIVGLGRGLPPIWRTGSLDRGTLEAKCRSAMSGSEEDTKLILDLSEHGVLGVWGDGGHEDCADWQRQWTAAIDEFPKSWEAIITAGGPTKTTIQRPKPVSGSPPDSGYKNQNSTRVTHSGGQRQHFARNPV